MLWFTAGIDYTAISQKFKFAPGQSTISVHIPIRDDNIALESNITFAVAIIPYGGVVILSNATVTIVDNDHGKLTDIRNNNMSAIYINLSYIHK